MNVTATTASISTMTSRDFCYWLQGHFEIGGHNENDTLDAREVAVIRNHLALVFKHEIDPSIAKPGTPEAALLDEIHAAPGFPKIGGTGPGGQVYRC